MVFRLAFQKIRAMAGGYICLALLLAASFVLFITANITLSAQLADTLNIATVNMDEGELSAEFLKRISCEEKLNIIVAESHGVALELVNNSKAEGILIIFPNFSAELAGGESVLSYRSTASSESAEAACEIIGGIAIGLRGELRAEEYAEALFGEPLTDEQRVDLEQLVFAEGEGLELDRICKITTVGSVENKATASVFSAFRARYAGFCAFLTMLILLQLGAFFGTSESSRVEQRLLCAKGGKIVSIFSDYLSLVIIGLLLGIIMYIAQGKLPALQEAAAFIAFILNVSALSVLVAKLFSASGRMSLAASFIAFITSLAGGCFINPEVLGGKLKTLQFFTPQGLYLGGMHDAPLNILVLILLSATFIAAAAFRIYYCGSIPFASKDYE